MPRDFGVLMVTLVNWSRDYDGGDVARSILSARGSLTTTVVT
jgi:hypothetical protein